MNADLPLYPFSHLLTPNNIEDLPVSVYVRLLKHDGNEGWILDICQYMSIYSPLEMKPNVYALLGNTLVTHWTHFDSHALVDFLHRTVRTSWITFIPLLTFSETVSTYQPPYIVGWRQMANKYANIEIGIENKNLVYGTPIMLAFNVSIKNRTASTVTSILCLLRMIRNIQCAWFVNGTSEDSNWSVISMLIGNFKFDKTNNRTMATILVYPTCSHRFENSFTNEDPDATVGTATVLYEY